MRETTISTWCERLIEAGWLLALTLIPIYFNLLSQRLFEPDKATTLRALVLIMAAAALVRAFEHRRQGAESPSSRGNTPPTGANAPPAPPFWRRLLHVPLAVPVLFYALVFILTTITSVVQHTSFWGSYQRLQGTYTNLSYIVLFVLIVATLRRREQLVRLVTLTLLASLPVAAYGIVQVMELDPLPWQGDVITRVASTMGNSIFVAAYLIMVVPLVLYRLVLTAGRARQAPASDAPAADALWMLAYAVLIGGTLALLFAVIKFGVAVQILQFQEWFGVPIPLSDMRYWWVVPGAVVVATALWWLVAVRPDRGEGKLPTWPGVLFLLYLLLFVGVYLVASGQTAETGEPLQQFIPPDSRPGAVYALDWHLWMIGSFVAVCGFYGMAFYLPRRPTHDTRLSLWLQTGGLLLLLTTLLLAILFTRSRGPWLGLGAGLFVFVSLLLWQAARHTAAQGAAQVARRLRMALGGWLALVATLGAFLVAFNVSNAPIFEPLRELPYVGRMGELLEVESGTGKVRLLIWTGDEHAGGTTGLIVSEPLHSLVGWGPESMFVAYNPFYPPTLGRYENRGASPDRAHQAILDQLVTRGFLGLLSYLFLLLSFFFLCWRLIRHSSQWPWQLFFIACLSTVVTHVVEGLTGIPIVSTLMLFWVTLAITVIGGMLAGHYVLGEVPSAEGAAPADAAAAAQSDKSAEPEPQRSTGKGRKTKGKRGRTQAPAPASPTPARSRPGPLWLTGYAAIFLTALALVWQFNLNVVYADMLYNDGQTIRAQRPGFLPIEAAAMQRYIQTIRTNPREDQYYLSLGRSLMTVGQYLRAQGVPTGQARADAQVADVLALQGTDEIERFIRETSPQAMLSYAEAVLEQARQLNDLNKDHSANLARLNTLWFDWTGDLGKLEQAAQWYAVASSIAPQDVVLLNEQAEVNRTLAAQLQQAGANAAAAEFYDYAEQSLQRAHALDPSYTAATVQLADLYRQRGNLERAADLFANAIIWTPAPLAPRVEELQSTFAEEPALLSTLAAAYADAAERTGEARYYALAGDFEARAGQEDTALDLYEQALTLDPQSLQTRLAYTLVLSDTQNYARALNEAQSGLSLAREQADSAQVARQFEQLVRLLETKVAGGQ